MPNITPTDILQRPYERVLIPEAEGGYSAYISEFEGCLAEGETPEEAFKNLEATAIAWIESEFDAGRDIPAAWNDQEFSGKLLLRLPKSLHRQLARHAEKEGISLNQYVLYRLSESKEVTRADSQVSENIMSRFLQLLAMAKESECERTVSFLTQFPDQDTIVRDTTVQLINMSKVVGRDSTTGHLVDWEMGSRKRQIARKHK